MPFSILAPLLIGGQIFSAANGANAANTASQTQQQGEQDVLNLLGQTQPQETSAIAGGVTGANGTLAQTIKNNLALLSPYATTGTNALAQLNGLTAAGGFKGPAPFTAPTAAAAESTPGYQFARDQGNLAVNQSAAAAGGALSGGALKASQEFGQGLADTNYNNVYNQALQGYQTNFGDQLQGYQTNFGNLGTLAGIGQNATNNAVSSSTALGSQAANNTLTGGVDTAGVLGTNFGNAANAITGKANASAAGTIGSANAINNGVTGGTSSLSNLLLLQQLLGGGNSSFGSGSGSSYNNTSAQNPITQLYQQSAGA